MRYSLTLLALLPVIAYAQIYQYIDPETGSTKITNLTPPWYSVNERGNGPRTLLIVRGNVVDDTRRPVDSATTQRALKQAAELYAAEVPKTPSSQDFNQTLRDQAAQSEANIHNALETVRDTVRKALPNDPEAQAIAGLMANAPLAKAAAQDQDTLRFNAQLEAQRRETLLRAQ